MRTDKQYDLMDKITGKGKYKFSINDKWEYDQLSKKYSKTRLNIGCGYSEDGTHFLDLYPTREEVIKYNADVDTIPFPDNFFDEVISEFVFEHLKDRTLFLSEVYRVLKKGGKFRLLTDNAGFILYHNEKSKIKTHYGGYTYDGKAGDDDKHYSLFTTQHIKQFLEDTGFKKVTTRLYNRDNFGFFQELFLTIIRHTRFRYMSEAMVEGVGYK